MALSFVLAWFAVMVLPRLDWRWRAVRAIARAALAAIGVPVAVAGLDRVPRGNAMLVFNHSSYMDALVLSAVLPGEPLYVVKRELAGQIFAGPFLRRLGALFVERYDVSGEPRRHRRPSSLPRGKAAISCTFQKARSLAEQGFPASISVLSRWPRKQACRSCPALFAERDRCYAVINGFRGGRLSASRSRMRSSLPERTSHRFCSCETAVRKVILAHCGEPDLGELVKPAASPDTT